MSHIIGHKCIDCIDTSCVDVCPVDCIHGPINTNDAGSEVRKQGKDKFPGGQLYIDPDVCIDCSACVYECPFEAVYKNEEEAIATNDEASVHRNYAFFGKKYE